MFSACCCSWRQGRELAELGDAVDELRDLAPEAAPRCRKRVLGVLGDVVEERGLDGDRVDAELGEDLRRRDRVGDVRLARGALLVAVRLDRRTRAPCGGGSTSASSSCLRIDAIRCSPAVRSGRLARAWRGRGGRARTRRSDVVRAPWSPPPWRRSPPFTVLAPLPVGPALCRAAPSLRRRPSVPSAAARREPFRAGRAAGTISAGRSARVRGATMVREV